MKTDAWNDVVQTGAARFYWLAVGVGSTLITTRYLGPDGRGVLAAAITWANLFTTVGYLSLPQVIMFLAASRREQEWLPSVVGTLLVIVGATAVVSWIVVAVMAGWPGANLFRHLPLAVMMATFAALPGMLWLENGNAVLLASNRLRVLNLAQVIGGSANLLLTFLLVAVFDVGVIGALVAILAAQLVTCAIGLRSIRQPLTRLSFDRPIAATLLSGGARLHFNAVGTFLVGQSGVLVLNHFRTSAETAYYQLALQLITAIQVLPVAVSTVAYGIVSREGADRGWTDHRRLLIQSLVAVSVVIVVAYAAAPVAVQLLAGREFLPAVDVFRILLLGVIGMTLSTVMASQWIGRGFFLRVAIMSTTSGLAVLGANWLVIPHYGMQGAAWVTAGIYTVSLFVNGIMVLWVERRWQRLTSPAERDADVCERGVAL